MAKTKYSLLLLLLTSLCIYLNSCGRSDRQALGETYAKEQLKAALVDSSMKEILTDTIIPDKQTATDVSEAILFAIYGKDNIINQRPYEIFLIDNFWVLNGTLPKGSVGGTFLIIINSKNGKVIRLTHGK